MFEKDNSIFFLSYKTMDTLSADMAQLMTSKKKGNSLLDVVGADINSSYDRPMSY